MRNIFLDIGAGPGTSAEYFLRSHKDFEVYSFECDRRNIQSILKKKLKIHLVPCAAWKADGTKKYYPANTRGGGTLYKNKKTGGINRNKFYNVTVVDLARYIKVNFSDEDYIIAKMNCEGAEYVLIPHLEKNGLISWIDEWFVNWHYNKIGMSREEHDRIVKMIPKPLTWKPK